MKLISGQSEYPIFNFWTHCGIQSGGYLIRIKPVNLVEFNEIKKRLVSIISFPAFCGLSKDGKKIIFWPVPHRNFDLLELSE